MSTPIRILLVEDSDLDAELLLDELTRDGMAVASERVENEAGFLEALQRFAPDLILSDLSMPEFSGYRALELARQIAPRTPFVFVSGTMGEETAVEAVRGGATDYVLKHNLPRLASSVRRALAEARERLAREQAETDLLRAQRYESLALLASGLSHDLRNVLQPISMGVSLLKDDPRPEIRKIGELITDCTQRGLEIVASMLSFAKGSRAAVSRVSVRSLIERLTMLLRSSVASNIVLRIAVPEPSVELEGNQTELQQCLLNLCLNAAQAMPDGGELKLEVAISALDTGFFQSGEAAAPGSYLKISVIDSGTGMSEEVQRNLFKPFFTTKAKGTGLGLLSCQRILENHKGFARVMSEPGRGTLFSIYLPLPVTPVETMAPAIVQGLGERVLIVIERESKLTLLRDIVESNGYVVSPAENGSVALQSIERDGLPDVVVMDAQMDLKTGVRTASALLERNFAGPVLMIAGSDRHLIEHDLPPLRRIRFIDRPVNPDQLLAVLAEETARSRSL